MAVVDAVCLEICVTRRSFVWLSKPAGGFFLCSGVASNTGIISHQ